MCVCLSVCVRVYAYEWVYVCIVYPYLYLYCCGPLVLHTNFLTYLAAFYSRHCFDAVSEKAVSYVSESHSLWLKKTFSDV